MTINYAPLCIFDFETGSRDPRNTQPTQVAALILDARTLTIKRGGTFNSEIRAIIDDDKARELGFAAIEDEALEVTGKTREKIDKAPEPKVVWNQFERFVSGFNKKKTQWFAPIPAGYNINGFDMPITERLCKAFGPRSKEGKQGVFSKIWKVDVMDYMWLITESNPDIKSISMDNLRKLMGFSSENAHDALQDVKDTAKILKACMLTCRGIGEKIDWKAINDVQI